MTMLQRALAPGPPANLLVALDLASKGLSVFPVHSGGSKAKQPMPFFRWRDQSSTDERAIRDWWVRWPDAAPALDVGKSGLLVIDADRHDVEHDGVEAWARVLDEHGFDPDSVPIVATPGDGNHYFFRQDGRFGNGRGSLPRGVDVRGTGGYVVAPGAVMADGRSYEVYGDPAAAPAMPAWLEEMLGKRTEVAAPSPAVIREFRTTETSDTGLDEIAALLRHIPADVGYDEWVQALMAVHAATGGSGAGLSVADAWSSGGSKYKAGEVERKWRSFKSAGVNGATLAALARQYGADLSAVRIAHLPALDAVAVAHGAAQARRLIEHADGTLTTEDGEVVEETVAPALSSAPANAGATSIFPPGLVGDIAEWICDTARRPQPALALGAALTIVGTAAGRQFVGPTNSATHLYVLGLAPTGAGKDHALQQIARILTASRMAHHLGPSEFISMPAVVNFLARSPLSLCAMDEFGDFMARIGNKRASGFERSISKVLRAMWSHSFTPYKTPEWAGKESATIHAPAISLYGASTPEQFWRAMEGGSVEDGTLNRFLLVGGDVRPPERDPLYDPTIVPSRIIDDMLCVFNRSGEMPAALRNQSDMDPSPNRRALRWVGPAAKAVYDDLARTVETKLCDPDASAFYARTAEMALRIATIVAVGRLDGEDAVTVEDMTFGAASAISSAKMMMAGAADYMADSDNQAAAQRVRRIIKERGGRVRWRDLLRAMQHSLKARDLKDVVSMLCEAEELEVDEVVPAGGGKKVIWYKSAG